VAVPSSTACRYLLPTVLVVTIAVRCAFARFHVSPKYQIATHRMRFWSSECTKTRFRSGWGSYEAPRPVSWERKYLSHSPTLSFSTDSIYRAVHSVDGRAWHSACLLCLICRCPLVDRCLTPDDGLSLYCRDDFYRYRYRGHNTLTSSTSTHFASPLQVSHNLQGRPKSGTLFSRTSALSVAACYAGAVS